MWRKGRPKPALSFLRRYPFLQKSAHFLHWETQDFSLGSFNSSQAVAHLEQMSPHCAAVSLEESFSRLLQASMHSLMTLMVAACLAAFFSRYFRVLEQVALQ